MLDFKVGYTQYVVPNTHSLIGTEDCRVMPPTGNRTGSVRMMSVSTSRLVIRDQFKLLPMPSNVTVRSNNMAASEGRRII